MFFFFGLESEIILNFDINSEDALKVTDIEENGTKEGEPYQFPGRYINMKFINYMIQ